MKIIYILLFTTLLYSSQSLSLDEALDILKENNLELKSATLEVNSAKAKVKTASGTNWGKLDFIQDFARSNDAGNVFGFKLSSREATFGDFGFADFLSPPPGTTDLLAIQPDDLNYPGYRNYFQSKLKYEVPVFTGFKISSYTNIMKSMAKMKTLEKEKLMSEKKYELRKSFYDMALLRTSEKHLNVILTNISKLEDITQNMIDVGYAKKVDLLEVKAKKGNVKRLISQMKSNQKLLFHYISFLLDRKVEDIQTPSGDVDMPAFSDEEILNSNIDIKRAGTGLVIRKNMIDVEQSAYYPMVGAFGEVATADDDFFNNAGKHKAYTIGARLTWNIFNGGVDGANIEKSRINYLKTQTQLALAKSGIALKIQKIRTQIETSNSDIESLQIELELANEIYKNYEARYKEKLSSMSDVIIKQTEQIQKILQLQQARNKRNERIFALEKLANGDI
jgi:outer membrane protein TolC